MTCVSGDSSEDKLKQLAQSFKKIYETASVYLREITGMRVLAAQLVFLFLLLLFVIVLNFKSFLNRKTKENAKISKVVVVADEHQHKSN